MLVCRDFTCGYCGREVSSDKGYINSPSETPAVYICPRCFRPNYFEGDSQFPDVSPAKAVDGLPKHVNEAYQEMRGCMTVAAYCAAAMMARKLLMNLAVSKGAKGNQSFCYYVDYVASNVVSPNSLPWIAKIKDIGNGANHELPAISKEAATQACLFVEMALRIAFEYPERASR